MPISREILAYFWWSRRWSQY